ncbi:MAG: ATP-binding cassette domain-containing protein [Puniceicoccales bacterium]|jgi:ATP-binding cassette subfamily F protein 3|nr:ATP-binding cassette domain-containing protein [Puniceicoccales bacterium]
MIDIENLTYRIGSRILFENATLHLPSSGKIGIVGPNGCGKTTLFRLILGQEEVDGGEIYIKNSTKIVCVKQEIESCEALLIDFVINADGELVRLRAILNDEKNISAEELASAYEAYDAIGGYSAEARAAAILAGLGFKQDDLGEKLGSFSGGWQVRASLAATLFAPSHCLLLDEPTNHLDFETAMWLENYLEKTDKMMLMISHEKQFLNKVCNHIVSIYDGKLNLFKGNYDTYANTRKTKEVALIRNITNLQKKRDHMQVFINRFGAKATKAKQAQSRVKMIEKMEIPEMPSSEYKVRLSFPQPQPQVDRRLVELEDVSAGYGNKVVLSSVEFYINSDDRIALLGANGNGKSTLAKVISGRLRPQRGTITYGRNVKISYFSQQQADELDVKKTPIAILNYMDSGFSETQARAHLAKFGITQTRSETTVENLSGGEKSRVLLAINSLHTPHAMVLDEPTNHLDIGAREALIEAIEKYEGAVILITHDFYTLEKTCNKFFIVNGGKCTPFTRSLDDYRRSLLAKDSMENGSVKNSRIAKSEISPDQKKSVGEDELLRLEREIAELEAKKEELEVQLSGSCDPALCVTYSDCCKELMSLEDKWLRSNYSYLT